MAKTKEQIKETFQKDLEKFQSQVDYYKKNKRKLILPKHNAQCIASASIVAYLKERIKEFD